MTLELMFSVLAHSATLFANILPTVCFQIYAVYITTQQTFLGLGDVFKTCLEDVFNTSSVWQFYVFQDVLKTSWIRREDILETSWKHYRDKQNTYWGYLYLTSLNVYLRNLYLTNLHFTILRRIQNALSRTHHFNICLILELKQHLYFKN